MVINLIVGVYIPIIRIPIKGGTTIPNIATFDHGTNESNQKHSWATKKTRPYFPLNPDCLIGILIMVYEIIPI